ncbi:hypothetical protein BC830DRAFT_1170175 [Chytriomyces sp. MP71]|nr:hypothetical protein BC830DRAFT_1170175 [Chytriomyces sp. MP71]
MLTTLLLILVAVYILGPIALQHMFAGLGPSLPLQRGEPTFHKVRVDRFTSDSVTLSTDIALPKPSNGPDLPLWFEFGFSQVRNGKLSVAANRLFDLELPDPLLLIGGILHVRQNGLVLRASDTQVLQRFVKRVKEQGKSEVAFKDLVLTLSLEANFQIMGFIIWRGIALETNIDLGVLLTNKKSTSAEMVMPVPETIPVSRPAGVAGMFPNPTFKPLPPVVKSTCINSGLTLAFSAQPSLSLRFHRIEAQVHLNDKHAASAFVNEFSIGDAEGIPSPDTSLQTPNEMGSHATTVLVEVRPRISGILTGLANTPSSSSDPASRLGNSPLGILKGLVADAVGRIRNANGEEDYASKKSVVVIRGVQISAFGAHGNVVRVQWLEQLVDAIEVKFDVDHDTVLSKIVGSGSEFSGTPSVRAEVQTAKKVEVVGKAVNLIGDVIRAVDRKGLIKKAVMDTLDMRDQDEDTDSGTSVEIIGKFVDGISGLIRKVDKEGLIKRAVTKRLSEGDDFKEK